LDGRPSDPGREKSGASSPGFNSTADASTRRVATLTTPTTIAATVAANVRSLSIRSRQPPAECAILYTLRRHRCGPWVAAFFHVNCHSPPADRFAWLCWPRWRV
jgi:hypothetical protein